MKYVASIVAMFVGILALVGWQWDIDILTRLLKSAPVINPLTAVGLILLGVEIIRQQIGSTKVFLKDICLVAIGLLLMLTALKLSDLLLNTTFNIDNLLFGEKFRRINTMSANEALAFFLLGMAVLSARIQSSSSLLIAQVLAIFSALISVLAIIGYAYKIPAFLGAGKSAPIALNAAIALLLQSWALLRIYTNSGLMKFIINDGPAGRMAGLLLPASIAIPFIFGWFGINALRITVVEPELNVALSVVFTIALLFSVIFICALSLFAVDNERKKAEADLYHMASHDTLTGLSNRRAFIEQLTKRIDLATRYKDYTYAVAYLDLDGFKRVNDSLSHLAGDYLLKEVAGILQSCARASDTPARLGGDEFTVLLEKINGPQDVIAFISRIQKSIAKAVEYDGKEIKYGISFGIAMAQSNHTSPEKILQAADEALYAAKSAGKGCYKFAVPELSSQLN
jgi:diguanylate cyclase (GGDEF)-like protein